MPVSIFYDQNSLRELIEQQIMVIVNSPWIHRWIIVRLFWNFIRLQLINLKNDRIKYRFDEWNLVGSGLLESKPDLGKCSNFFLKVTWPTGVTPGKHHFFLKHQTMILVLSVNQKPLLVLCRTQTNLRYKFVRDWHQKKRGVKHRNANPLDPSLYPIHPEVSEK